ncbi:MAG: hypothetical protein A2X23_05330 [Chloroflexi bacterium GWC2_73_18]|nr:MAG: hypothetical protein A2X23_05330 [Chloroflexi bacterium GWC2_73_18]
MMVVSIDPGGSVTAVGLPRDLVLVPLSDGTTWQEKLNALLAWADKHPQEAPEGGFAYLEREIGWLLGLEIDGYVFSGFEGVRRVVDALGGVDIVLDKPVDDPYYWIDATHRGIHFPAGPNHFDGRTALIFARTRKGDNDFDRMRRQQQLVRAVVREAVEAGPEVVTRLLPVVAETLKTDLSLEQGLALYELVARLDETRVESAVLGPRKYASAAYGPWGYGLRPDLEAIRAYVARTCPPVPPVEASPAPSSTPAVP